ncbi:Na+/H+ antiporter [Acidisoma cladoniae]|jgi:Na+/H+ antiporter|uniref:Na+/H+ antiporter n=1 Tax=Acidisoma cladoniae TaxID=3040935 RepID=UPI00254CA05D|nr:Na+/H+ antiporter [Acidisoma sp. PAMC 29798]
MELLTTILLLLFVTALTNLVTRFIRLPLPLLQIAAGAACDMVGVHLSIDPALFLLLFIPPLLFADAYRIPKRELSEVGVPVVVLAVGLVLFTTIGVGYFVHWLLPFLPLAAAFALAAVLSPTDAVALGGIMNGQRLPRRFMHVLQGEALLNDASGLVSFNVAVAVVLTGSFSFTEAALSFVCVSLGGLLIGALFGWAFVHLDRRLLSRQMEETSIYIVLTLLLPFAAYLAAEEIRSSGILAAVAAGITINVMDPFGGGAGVVRRRTYAIWGVMEFAFNGLIFLLLGLQLPAIVKDGLSITETAHRSGWKLLSLIVLVTLSLVVLRFLWVMLTVFVRYWMARLRRQSLQQPGLIVAAVASVAGVRGAVTLAGILSLPLVLNDGSRFKGRDLLICIAAGVIMSSLLLAVVALPPLIRRLPVPEVDPVEAEVEAARNAMAQGVIRELEGRLAKGIAKREGVAREVYEAAVERVISDYRLKLQGRDGDDENQMRALEDQRVELAIRLRGVRVERAEMRALRANHTINDEAVRVLMEEIDLEEEALMRLADILPPRERM